MARRVVVLTFPQAQSLDVTGAARRSRRVASVCNGGFVRDGDVATSAGVTAGMDLALALVEDDLGAFASAPHPEPA